MEVEIALRDLWRHEAHCRNCLQREPCALRFRLKLWVEALMRSRIARGQALAQWQLVLEVDYGFGGREANELLN